MEVQSNRNDKLLYKDPWGKLIKKIAKKEIDKVKTMMPEMIFDEIMIAYKEMIDDKIKMLISDKLMIAETETDIDRESR